MVPPRFTASTPLRLSPPSTHRPALHPGAPVRRPAHPVSSAANGIQGRTDSGWAGEILPGSVEPPLLSSACTGRDEGVEWGYRGPGAPHNWARLSDDFLTCEEGKQQSPVDIPEDGARREPLEAASVCFSYGCDSETIRNDGRTVHVGFGEGNTLSINSRSYRLGSAHLHSPSEHLIDGQGFAAELHLVHHGPDGALMVLGRLFEPGPPDPVVQAILEAAPRAGSGAISRRVVNAGALVPDNIDHYRYRGSLTQPPCFEPVEWHVLSERGTISTEQVANLLALAGGPNNRPVQSLGDRVITKVSG